MKVDQTVIDALHDICMNSNELDIFQALTDVLLNVDAPEEFVMKLEAEADYYLSNQ